MLVGEAPVMGPGDERAAVAEACGHLRAFYTHREQMIDTIRPALIQGQLVKDELDVLGWVAVPALLTVMGALRLRV
jgi:hypothetical protein